MRIGVYAFLLTAVIIFILAGSGLAYDQTYIIGDEDVLQISVWGSPELGVQVPVRPDGMISIPVVGDIKAAGLAPHELKAVIEKKLASFVKTPTVSVIVIFVNSFKVYVFGEGLTGGVGATTGVITLHRNTTLMQLLAQLGSLKNADLNNAYVLRDGKKLNNDFFKLMVKGEISEDIQLRPNDLIFMPDNFDKRIMVVGAVRTPIVIQYREGITALDAVLSAGGFTEFANQNSVLVVRKTDKATSNIEVRLKDVINGDISKNIVLKPGDIVTVKTGIF